MFKIPSNNYALLIVLFTGLIGGYGLAKISTNYSFKSDDKTLAFYANGYPVYVEDLNKFLAFSDNNLEQDSDILQLDQDAQKRIMLEYALIELTASSSTGLRDVDQKQYNLWKNTSSEIAKKHFLSRSYIDAVAREGVDDEQLRQLYDEILNNVESRDEMKVRHILLEKKSKALQLLNKIKKAPSQFEELAKRDSLDEGTKELGGDLGYVTQGQLSPDFGKVVFDMEKGSLSKKPFKTDLGWHIVKVDDRRKIQPAAFEDVKEALRQDLLQQRREEYVNNLLNNIEIQAPQS